MTVTDTTAMKGYTQAIADLPAEAFLGSLVYFTISAADVDLSKARRDLEDAGLDVSLLKSELRPRDAFAKTSRKLGRRFKPVNSVKSELKVVDTGEDAGQAYRQLILQRVRMVSGEKRVVFYEKVAELTLDKGERKDGEYINDGVQVRRTTTRYLHDTAEDGTPTSTPYEIDLTAEEDEWLTEGLASFADDYDHLLHYLDSHAVRTFVREYIYRLRGICVKESGGLYFVKQDKVAEAAKLATWVKAIGSEFHTLPLLNLGEQRDMILQAFEEEAIADVGKMMTEVKKILLDPDRKIEEKTYEGYIHKMIDLTSKVKEYDNMLGSRAARAEMEIEIFKAQVEKLGGRIKSASTMRMQTIPSVGVAP